MRKSMSLESGWRIARIWRAPSDALVGAGVAAGRAVVRRVRPSVAATSSGIAPLNRMAKKLRKARIKRFIRLQYFRIPCVGDGVHWLRAYFCPGRGVGSKDCYTDRAITVAAQNAGVVARPGASSGLGLGWIA